MAEIAAAAPNAATDTRIDPQVRSFLAKINKDTSPFWELPQPKPQRTFINPAKADGRRHVWCDGHGADHQSR
jgi:hypothetical protein